MQSKYYSSYVSCWVEEEKELQYWMLEVHSSVYSVLSSTYCGEDIAVPWSGDDAKVGGARDENNNIQPWGRGWEWTVVKWSNFCGQIKKYHLPHWQLHFRKENTWFPGLTFDIPKTWRRKAKQRDYMKHAPGWLPVTCVKQQQRLNLMETIWMVN